MLRRKKIKYKLFLMTGIMPVFFLAGCAGSAVPQTQAPVTQSVSLTAEAGNPDALFNDSGVSYDLPHIIKQRESSFGDNGCGGAAGLMALQAAGYLNEYDTDTEYTQFWNTVPKAADATAGFNGNGIWNPAYADWLATYTEAKRVQGLSAEDIKGYLSDGNIVIVLVSLGETGKTTHWMTVTGWKITEGLLIFDVADPWSGTLHEYTAARLQRRMDEGAKRKGDFGAGYETDGVLVK